MSAKISQVLLSQVSVKLSHSELIKCQARYQSSTLYQACFNHVSIKGIDQHSTVDSFSAHLIEAKWPTLSGPYVGFNSKDWLEEWTYSAVVCYSSFDTKIHVIWGAGRAQWWECSPPTNVSWVWFPDSESYLGWVCCWYSTLLREVFLQVLQKKKNVSKFQF